MIKGSLIAIACCLVGCTGHEIKNSKIDKQAILKDTIHRDSILKGITNGEVIITHLDNSGRIVDYKFDDTINIELSYKGKYPSLNENYELIVEPIGSEVTVVKKNSNKYTLLIDTSGNLTEFSYHVSIYSDKCLFMGNYPKKHFSSEMGLFAKICTR